MDIFEILIENLANKTPKMAKPEFWTLPSYLHQINNPLRVAVPKYRLWMEKLEKMDFMFSVLEDLSYRPDFEKNGIKVRNFVLVA